MKIKYKDTEIYRGSGNALCVEYLYDDPDHNPPQRKKNKFFFNFSMVHNPSYNRTSEVDRIHFKAGMDWAPQRMKVTMEELKTMFNIFKENGGGTIDDFLSFILSEERKEKLKQLGI
jgi:hypothetical protein